MTIHDRDRYMAGIWDWAILDGCFGSTRIKPTDIDGLVERNGRFLFLETKSIGAQLPIGQERTFKALVKAANATVIVVWGCQNQPTACKVFSPQYPNGYMDNNITVQQFRNLVINWFNDVEANHVNQ